MKILIKNGTIVTSDKTFKSDILIKNESIELISEQIKASDKYDQIIDANDRYIFPGGIDPHVHMNLPTPAGYSSDDFYTGSKAALLGGTTTIIDFVTPQKGQSLVEALQMRKKEAEKSLIDFSFHVSPVEWTKNTEEEINNCIKEGITSFKVYMAYKKSIGLDDKSLEKVVKAVAKAKGLLVVHAEMDDTIEELRDKYAKEGKLTPEYHAESRPPYTESEAVRKIIDMAGKNQCSLYIVHVSAKESIMHIADARKQARMVFAEVCPHHLLLDDTKYKGDFDETCAFVLSPPLRKSGDCEALWQKLEEYIIQTIGTDHCPFTLKQKQMGKDDFRKIPNGAGSVEHRMSLLYTYGVLKNRISLNRFVEVTSTNAAKIFGLYPQKGEIAVGSDADLLIWNPEIKNIISAKSHHQNSDLNIFENFETVGAAEYVITKGIAVTKNGEILCEPKGNFLKR
ncbi:MAG: dihydropyrimidinase [Bacteroidota bacterium]